MSVALDVHQRKGVLKTVLIGIGLLFMLLFFGLRHYDPPLQRGIIIALGSPEGTSSQNISVSGDNTESPAEQEVASEDTVVESSQADSDTQTQAETITDTPTETPSEPAVQPQTQEQIVDEATLTEEQMLVTESAEVVVTQEVALKPDAATAEALKRILGGQSAAANKDSAGGNSSDQQNQTALGADDGSPLSESPYNLGIGLDGDGNYLLGGRRALHKEIIVQDCNQAGRVVVSIEVNQQGQVITAMPGVRGTTNNAPCLLDPARRAALATEFNPDPKAPSRQIGKIIYVFRLTQ
jgi:protein TonB